MSALMVRVDELTRETLRELSKTCDEKMSVLLACAVEDFRRKKFLEAANAAYETLRADPKARAADEIERDLWDGVASDGLPR